MSSRVSWIDRLRAVCLGLGMSSDPRVKTSRDAFQMFGDDHVPKRRSNAENSYCYSCALPISASPDGCLPLALNRGKIRS